MKVGSYTVVYTRDEEGGFIVTVPALKGVVTYGDTLEEAQEMAKEAIEGFLEALHSEGLPIPEEGQTTAVAEQINVKVPA